MIDKREHIPHHIHVPLKFTILFGSIGSMVATTAVHPLDVIKVRLQLLARYCTMKEMAHHIITCKGYGGLFFGLTASLMRQATYTTTRLAVYHKLYTDLRHKKNSRPTLREKMEIATVAGVVGAIAGNPSEVVLIRMMADGSVEPCVYYTLPKRYRNFFHALYRIRQEEGIRALWRGGTLTIGRTFFVSVSQLSTYEKARELMEHRRLASGLPLHVCTTLISSLFAAFISLPVDLVKTRYQVRRINITQNEIFTDILREKGIRFFWKGFVPYYIRLAIQSFVGYAAVENLHNLYHYYTDT